MNECEGKKVEKTGKKMSVKNSVITTIKGRSRSSHSISYHQGTVSSEVYYLTNLYWDPLTLLKVSSLGQATSANSAGRSWKTGNPTSSCGVGDPVQGALTSLLVSKYLLAGVLESIHTVLTQPRTLVSFQGIFIYLLFNFWKLWTPTFFVIMLHSDLTGSGRTEGGWEDESSR